ncbi:MAG: hypothetical protein HOO96_37595 [Polyangiaceae bacterium]|nr:hypothetical protein [Polyangiaceae bacterium]
MIDFDLTDLAKEIRVARGRVADLEIARRLGQPLFEPFQGIRRVATKTTFESLKSLESTAFGRGARAHVAQLLQARLLQELDAEIATEMRAAETRVDLDAPLQASLRDIRQGLLESRGGAHAEAYFDAFARAQGRVAPMLRERAERRLEIAKRLGQGAHDELALPLPRAAIEATATQFLKDTEALAEAQLQELGKRREVSSWPLACILQSIGKSADHGWPAHLQPRWLHETFPHLATARIDPKTGEAAARRLLGRPPLRAGSSSFVRFLYRFGVTLGESVPERDLAMVERADPLGIAPCTWGVVLASLPLERLFHRTVLGSMREKGQAHVREIAQQAFFAARVAAFTVLGAHAGARSELEPRVFGARLPQGLGGNWPVHDDAARARWVAFLRAHGEREKIVGTFDEDWFRNPRAAEYFLVCEPLVVQSEAPEGWTGWVRTFEERLA